MRQYLLRNQRICAGGAVVAPGELFRAVFKTEIEKEPQRTGVFNAALPSREGIGNAKISRARNIEKAGNP